MVVISRDLWFLLLIVADNSLFRGKECVQIPHVTVGCHSKEVQKTYSVNSLKPPNQPAAGYFPIRPSAAAQLASLCCLISSIIWTMSVPHCCSHILHHDTRLLPCTADTLRTGLFPSRAEGLVGFFLGSKLLLHHPICTLWFSLESCFVSFLSCIFSLPLFLTYPHLRNTHAYFVPLHCFLFPIAQPSFLKDKTAIPGSPLLPTSFTFSSMPCVSVLVTLVVCSGIIQRCLFSLLEYFADDTRLFWISFHVPDFYIFFCWFIFVWMILK